MSAPRRSSDGIRALVLLIPVSGCAAFGPNLTGRWTGACEAGPTMRVMLEVADVDAELSGEGVLTVTLPSGADDKVEIYVTVDGDRTRRDALFALDTGGGPPGTAEVDGTLHGDVFEATLGGALWSLPLCTVDLER